MKKYTIETSSAEGWMDSFDGFSENSTVYDSLEEALEAKREAIDYARSQGYQEEFIASIGISTFDDE